MMAPVLLIIFNRPELTRQVFNAIREARPTQLFIAADGPRTVAEKVLTDAARAVTEHIDWPCEVQRNYAEYNMGCKHRPASAISWAFETVEELIILEDDCLPHPDFFTFCEAMLFKYRDEEKVMHISGDCFLPFDLNESYYFTNYTHVWGWATYRRSWQKMDLSMADWEKLKATMFLTKRLQKKYAVAYWEAIFNNVAFDDPKIWDYQWTYSVWKEGGIAIAPAANLISNIGFGTGATHTLDPENNLAHKKVSELVIKKHPEMFVINRIADTWIRDHIYSIPPKNIFIKLLEKIGA